MRQAEGVLMKKLRKPTSEPVQWAVYIMRAKGMYLGHVEARDGGQSS